ncbi:hypothetical protein [Halococcus sp. AFM35]|uniref:hypothetical protein n=1 Tax=Halococcus sp. AFM35 TaxID=3421653 RepID=UPI003EBD41D6
MSIHYPDKVRGVQIALRDNGRAIREGRFGDAKRHALASSYLLADLRDERGQR